MEIVNRLLNFDKLIGSMLVKFLYYIGIIGIVLATLGIMFSGFSMGFLQGLGTIVIGPIAGAIMLLFWRFYCELFLIMFKISNDLSEIKAVALKTSPPATPPPAV